MIKRYSQYIKESFDDEFDYEEEEDVDSSFITDKEFKKFLIDNNSLDEFTYNCSDFFKDDFKNYNREEYFALAFDWSVTPEKYRYWNLLSKEWSNYCHILKVKERGEKDLLKLKRDWEYRSGRTK